MAKAAKARKKRAAGGAVRPRVRKTVIVRDRMQKGYRYALVAPVGCDFDPAFKPELTPQKMLALGVFGGKYMTDCRREFPKSWFTRAKLAKGRRDAALNYFGVDASRSCTQSSCRR